MNCEKKIRIQGTYIEWNLFPAFSLGMANSIPSKLFCIFLTQFHACKHMSGNTSLKWWADTQVHAHRLFFESSNKHEIWEEKAKHKGQGWSKSWFIPYLLFFEQLVVPKRIEKFR